MWLVDSSVLKIIAFQKILFAMELHTVQTNQMKLIAKLVPINVQRDIVSLQNLSVMELRIVLMDLMSGNVTAKGIYNRLPLIKCLILDVNMSSNALFCLLK